ncbi:Alpha/Beta hydrolase protein [Haematococcus lacustris]
MVLPKGYPLEKHITVTGNGYVLVSFRIPFGRSKVSKPGSGVARQPVLLIHGISLASTCWVVNSDTDSLAFILANQGGYDVWMMNTRGNTFSRGHETYPTSDSNYWRFSMDEMATQDLPAILQYIRAVHIVGHSQGATLALAMLADKPSLGSGVGLTVALAPVVYVKYIQSQVMVAFCIQSNVSRSAWASAVGPRGTHEQQGCY